MADYDTIARVIKDAGSLRSMAEKLIRSMKGIEKNECRNLITAVHEKLEELKKGDEDLRYISKRAIHSERLAAMGQMAAAISHELRNPLSGIKIAAEYLMRKLKGQPDVIDVVVNIHNEVIFANNIIANILEHARISSPHCEKVSIKKLIEEAILTIAQQGSFNAIEIKKEISSTLPLLNLDPLQIQQVFMNLFINASEAMLGGGILHIKAYQHRGDVIVQVIDNGGGIERSHLEKLFEPFFSTKVKGIGLGLAITKEIIENHSGRITVESKLGKGTTVSILLPTGGKK